MLVEFDDRHTFVDFQDILTGDCFAILNLENVWIKTKLPIKQPGETIEDSPNNTKRLCVCLNTGATTVLSKTDKVIPLNSKLTVSVKENYCG